jgi:hypothetical protein
MGMVLLQLLQMDGRLRPVQWFVQLQLRRLISIGP